MTTTDQPSAPSAAAEGRPCANCGSPMAADQRYCLSCGGRRGEPRVAVATPAPEQAAAAPAATPPPGRPNDVSPLAAVFGIALLGGMLLIGVLIGRGSNNDEAPAPVVQVGEPTAGATTTTPAPDGGGGAPETAETVTSEWPQGTDGFTVQLNTLPKPATAADVELAKRAAVDGGAADAAVLDSDLYPSLAPGNYVIYSGVFTARKDAEGALKGLEEGAPSASVVEVSQSGDAAGGDTGAVEPATPEDQVQQPEASGAVDPASEGNQ